MTRWICVALMASSVFAAEEGFTPLFDGKTSAGWRSVSSPEFPKTGWTIEDGVITVLGKKGGDVVTTKKYASFDLRFEFKVTDGANSGVKYFIQPEKTKNVGYEYQVLDDLKHPDAHLGVGGNHSLASLYDLIPARADKKPKPVGEWNEGRIVVNGDHIEHWLNGEKVVECDRATPEFKAHFEASKFKKDTGFCTRKDGCILLQDHGNVVSFRNIRIKELN